MAISNILLNHFIGGAIKTQSSGKNNYVTIFFISHVKTVRKQMFCLVFPESRTAHLSLKKKRSTEKNRRVDQFARLPIIGAKIVKVIFP